MKIAVMQPYFFPYIGYYQLAYSVDDFVFFDDVNYIKKGFVNKNSIYSQGAKHSFVLPIQQASQNTLIKDLFYLNSFNEFKKKIDFNYSKAPFKKNIDEIINEIASKKDKKVSEINSLSIQLVFRYLGINKKFSFSSNIDNSQNLKASQRIIFICKQKSADFYHNAIGGMDLYDKKDFLTQGINLNFLKSVQKPYTQGINKNHFIDNLSMLDMLMWVAPEEICSRLKDYELIN